MMGLIILGQTTMYVKLIILGSPQKTSYFECSNFTVVCSCHRLNTCMMSK